MTAPTPDVEAAMERVDLAALERKLKGGASVTCCRHPDIDGRGYGPESYERQCVIDHGEPESCDRSSKDAGPDRVSNKAHCPYWGPRQFKRPQRLSVAEGLTLLALAREAAGLRKALKCACDDLCAVSGTLAGLKQPLLADAAWNAQAMYRRALIPAEKETPND